MSRFLLVLLLLMSLALVACGDEDEENGATEDNSAPLSANAGEDFEVIVGESPRFDGCASSGNIENYAWTVLNPPESAAEDVGKVIRAIETNCAFTLEDTMAIEEVGEWVIQLEVSSGEEIANDTVIVTVIEAETTPEEAATSDITE